MRKVKIVALTILSACCSHSPKFTEEKEAPKVVILPVDHSQDVAKSIESQSIEAIVNASPCKDTYWKDRGKAPLGYMVGMAKSYAQAKCDKFLSEKLTRPVTATNDALKKYNLKPTLPNVYSFLTALGMRESSGKHCTGRDLSASFTEAWSAESGAFQTSLDSKNYASYLYPFFKNWNKECFLPDFSKNVTCKAHDAKIWGNATTQYGKDGIEFQKKSKSCPAFQAEYTALVFRENLNHFGPIKRMEVQFIDSCKVMFEQIDAVTKCP